MTKKDEKPSDTVEDAEQDAAEKPQKVKGKVWCRRPKQLCAGCKLQRRCMHVWFDVRCII